MVINEYPIFINQINFSGQNKIGILTKIYSNEN